MDRLFRRLYYFIIHLRGFFDNKIEYEVIYCGNKKINAQQQALAVCYLGREQIGAEKYRCGKDRGAGYEYYGEANAGTLGSAFAAGYSVTHQRIIAEQGEYERAVLFAGNQQRHGGNQQPYSDAVPETVLQRHYRYEGEQRQQQGENAGKRVQQQKQQCRPGTEKRQSGLVL